MDSQRLQELRDAGQERLHVAGAGPSPAQKYVANPTWNPAMRVRGLPTKSRIQW